MSSSSVLSQTSRDRAQGAIAARFRTAGSGGFARPALLLATMAASACLALVVPAAAPIAAPRLGAAAVELATTLGGTALSEALMRAWDRWWRTLHGEDGDSAASPDGLAGLESHLVEELTTLLEGGGALAVELGDGIARLLAAVDGVQTVLTTVVTSGNAELQRQVAEGFGHLAAAAYGTHDLVEQVAVDTQEIRRRLTVVETGQRLEADHQRQALVELALLTERLGVIVSDVAPDRSGTGSGPAPRAHADPARNGSGPVGDCPYPGLASFGLVDANRFFGRRRETAQLVARLSERLTAPRPLVVLGPSGSGKSSLLRAGLVPSLLHGALPVAGSGSWPVLSLTPGSHPLATLAASIARVSTVSANTLDREFRRDPAGVVMAVQQAVLADSDRTGTALEARSPESMSPQERVERRRLVLVVDQFEETFTHCTDATERQSFVTALVAAAQSGGALVVLGLRSDFFSRCADFDTLVPHLQDDLVLVGPLSQSGLREAIEAPAAAARVELEPGLVDLMLEDLGAVTGSYEPGRLPLLAHALRETWERRSGNRLTEQGYLATQGISGSVAAAADRVYADLDEPGRHGARRLFLHLVSFDHVDGSSPDGVADIRRRVGPDELAAQFGGSKALHSLLDPFITARLITADEDGVRITHEALLRAWPRLRGWLSEDRDSLRLHADLSRAAAEWDRLGRDPGALWRGARLAAVRDRGDRGDPRPRPGRAPTAPTDRGAEHARDLSVLDRAFLDASITSAEAERAAETRRTRRLQVLVTGLSILLVGVTAAGAFAVQQRRAAQHERGVALSRQLALQSADLAEPDTELAALLAVQAFRQSDTPEAGKALLESVNRGLPTRFQAADGDVNDISLSPDGQVLAGARLDGAIVLWSTSTHQKIGELHGHTGPVYRVVFTPDGSQVLSAGKDGTLRWWDLVTRQQVTSVTAHDGAAVAGVAVAPDGALVATAGVDGSVRLWEASTRRRRAVLTGHTDKAQYVAFSPDGRSLASGGNDGMVRLWDVATRRPVAAFGPQQGPVVGLAWSPDGSTVAATDATDYTVALWDVASGAVRTTLEAHSWDPTFVAFSPDGSVLASVSRDSTVRLWNATNGRLLETLTGHGDEIYGLTFSPDGRSVVSAGNGGVPRRWDVGVSVAHHGATTAVDWAPDGRTAVSAGEDGRFVIWDASTRRTRRSVVASNKPLSHIAFSPDGHSVATVDKAGEATIWDPQTGVLKATLPTRQSATTLVSWGPHGRHVLTAGPGGSALLWDVESRSVVRTLPGDPNGERGHSDGVTDAVFSPDGRLIATSSDDWTVRLWDADSGRLRHTIPSRTGYVKGVRFSPDGRYVVSVGGDRVVRGWNAADGTAAGEFSGHRAQSWHLAFTPDGDRLATSSADGTVRIWDVATQQPLAVLGSGPWPLAGVAFSPDGATLLAAGDDGAVRWWTADVRKKELVRRICSALHDDITPTQWSRYVRDAPFLRTC